MRNIFLTITWLDGILALLLKKCAFKLGPVLIQLFIRSYNKWNFPDGWKMIQPGLEYCSVVWRAAAWTTLALFDPEKDFSFDSWDPNINRHCSTSHSGWSLNVNAIGKILLKTKNIVCSLSEIELKNAYMQKNILVWGSTQVILIFFNLFSRNIIKSSAHSAIILL